MPYPTFGSDPKRDPRFAQHVAWLAHLLDTVQGTEADQSRAVIKRMGLSHLEYAQQVCEMDLDPIQTVAELFGAGPAPSEACLAGRETAVHAEKLAALNAPGPLVPPASQAPLSTPATPVRPSGSAYMVKPHGT